MENWGCGKTKTAFKPGPSTLRVPARLRSCHSVQRMQPSRCCAHLHTLPVCGGPPIDVAARLVATHKADSSNVWMVKDAVDRVMGAVHDVEHSPTGQASRWRQVGTNGSHGK